MATAPSDRTRVRRVPQRGAYERETIDAILDETLISHVGFLHDGHPVVIPTLHARLGDRLYLHGSAASRMLRTLAKGVPVCATATLVDGLVLARSAFHHSVNYRSVVVFGTATLVEPGEETVKALELFTEKLLPGRWADVRPPTRQELKGTKVLSLPLDEASAKVRTGPPIDEDEDYDLPVWAGVLPLATEVAEPQPDPRLDPAIETPGYVAAWRP
jgi:nitroimidazol reductase NimA-like FMN-containing flavoprotein (pyridoxamine 5'-phosphate oxidase superfamily)